VDRLAGLGPLTRLVVTLLPPSSSQEYYTLGLATRNNSIIGAIVASHQKSN
jgi:hypothetical protein